MLSLCLGNSSTFLRNRKIVCYNATKPVFINHGKSTLLSIL